MISSRPPIVVGIGGTVTEGSSTEKALNVTLKAAEREGAIVRSFGGAILAQLPHYLAHGTSLHEPASALVQSIREADGLVIASPGYHGSISGLVKNAIDYIEETAKDKRVYLDGVPVGLIATAYGWQATANTLATLRSIVHALRGWPTPMGAAINSAGGVFKGDECTDAAAVNQLEMVGRQVVEFARLRLANPSLLNTSPEESGQPEIH